jgi:hypothetical protein
VKLTLGRLRAVLDLGIRRRVLAPGKNVARYVTIPRAARKAAKAKKRQQKPWTGNEVRTFLAHVASDRLYAVMLLSLIGLRPAEASEGEESSG